MILRNVAMAIAAAGLAACANYEVAETGAPIPAAAIEPYAEWPDELRGRTAHIVTDTGVTNVVNFAPDGTMTIQVEPGAPVVKGVYGLRGNTLCVNFAPRGEECWPYLAPLVLNKPVQVVSNRGQNLTVTMIR